MVRRCGIDERSWRVVFAVLAAQCIASVAVAEGPVEIPASVETEPVPTAGDAADDPAIWIHPTAPELSRIYGTDKQAGLAVYDLAGSQLQFLADGRLNNIEVRYALPVGAGATDFVAGSNRSTDTISVYSIHPDTGLLTDITAGGGIPTTIAVYGFCLYRSAVTGKYYGFVDAKSGVVEQYELADNGSGLVEGTLVRSFDVGTQVEACVADDERGLFYIGEEDVGIWRYGAEPGDGTSRTLVDDTSASGNLVADVEGLTLYHASDGTGYLIAASQGSDEFAVYEREGSNAFLGIFKIAGGAIDPVDAPDGIAVTSAPLGPTFPFGVFVSHDDLNEPENQNFKLVPWDPIASALSLTVDTGWDPRPGTVAVPALRRPGALALSAAMALSATVLIRQRRSHSTGS